VRRVILATLILALALPAGALAQSGNTNPFGPVLPVSPAPTPPATTQTTLTPTTTTTGAGNLSGGGIAAIAIGALVLLGGISLFIWRDARRRAPVRHRVAGAGAGDGGRPGSKRTKPRKLSAAERRRRKRGRAR
jgi:hypothetical protein